MLDKKVDVFLKKIIFELLRNSRITSIYSLQNGASGVALFLYEYGKIKKIKKYEVMGKKLILSCLDNQLTEGRNTSFYHGPAGSLWCALYMKIPHKKLLKYESLKQEIIQNIRATLIYDGLYELAHGATGWGVFSERLSGKDRTLQKDIKAYLLKTRKMNPRKLWALPPMYEDSGKIAWGYAHGVLGPLAWLDESRSAAFIYKELKSSLNRPNSGIEGSEPKGEILPQSAWCYGDAGIGYALTHLSAKHGNKKIQKIGTDLFIRGISGFPIYRYPTELSICHGKAGALLLSTLHYKLTRDKRSLELSQMWLEKILESKETDITNLPVGLLNGLSGLGLSLLEFKRRQISSWPRVLMLV